MATEIVLGLVMMGALSLYVLLGGADFGGGVWDLLAFGPRKRAQRELIANVISPVWETNHVWLILTVVVLFAAFPAAFAAISIALHVPLTVFSLGVVFRGSAFTFRAYDVPEDAAQKDRVERRWGLVFSLASLIAPILLGMIVGAVASGRIRYVDGVVVSGFFATWCNPFSFVVGLFALSLFAFLAATYLASDATSAAAESPGAAAALVEDFRARALISGAAVGLFALLSFGLSFEGAPLIRKGLTERPWTWPLHVVTAAAAATALFALYRRRFRVARVAVIVQTTMILLGWAASQYPYLVVPDLTLRGAAANARTQELLLWALAVGSVVLFPSIYVLLRVFRLSKGGGPHRR